ncbi:50S ribosomal protein L4 [Candidatus Uhrbacteria bacterium]|nr:50S ribosomal protein L4 [Candidatus Uhrbacteria bacterium]
MQIAVYNQKGGKVSVVELNDTLFGVKASAPLLHQVVVAEQANARQALAHTKTRGEVRGGGKKPWKQKGTGRARAGSIRSPIWRGGGIVFGPRKTRNYSQKINKGMRRKALAMVLSQKASAEEFVVLDTLEAGLMKTKTVSQILKTLPLKRGRTIVALPKAGKAAQRILKNIARVKPMWVGSLNVKDLLANVNLVTTVDGLHEMEKIYVGK